MSQGGQRGSGVRTLILRPNFMVVDGGSRGGSVIREGYEEIGLQDMHPRGRASARTCVGCTQFPALSRASRTRSGLVLVLLLLNLDVTANGNGDRCAVSVAAIFGPLACHVSSDNVRTAHSSQRSEVG